MQSAARELLAGGVLAGLGAVLVVLAVRAKRRTRFTTGQALLMALNYAYTRIIWRTTVVGTLELDPDEGALFVSNHRCSLDPAFIGRTVDRMVHWMVAKEYVDSPWIGWLFRVCRSIPVSRGGIDTAATKMAIRYAQGGGLVGIFPEGRINTTRRLLLPGRPGAALVALRARVKVVPCYIEGSPFDGTVWGCLFMSAKVRLVIGRPIDLSPYYDRADDRQVQEMLTKRFLKEIAALAGDPDFQPSLAGRFYKPEQ